MSLSTSLAQLHDALKTMRVHWAETSSQWSDGVRNDFAKHHWEPLENQVVAVLKEMDRLAQVMTQLRNEVSQRDTHG